MILIFLDSIPSPSMSVTATGPASLAVNWDPVEIEIDGWAIGVRKVENSDFEEDSLNARYDQVLIVFIHSKQVALGSYLISLTSNCA